MIRTKRFSNKKRERYYITDELDFHFYQIYNKEEGVFFSYIAKAKDCIGDFFINFDGTIFDKKIDMVLKTW